MSDAAVTILGLGLLALVGWSLWLRHRMIVTALEHGHEVSLGDDQ